MQIKKAVIELRTTTAIKVFVSFIFSCFYKPLLCELELFKIAKGF